MILVSLNCNVVNQSLSDIIIYVAVIDVVELYSKDTVAINQSKKDINTLLVVGMAFRVLIKS